MDIKNRIKMAWIVLTKKKVVVIAHCQSNEYVIGWLNIELNKLAAFGQRIIAAAGEKIKKDNEEK